MRKKRRRIRFSVPVYTKELNLLIQQTQRGAIYILPGNLLAPLNLTVSPFIYAHSTSQRTVCANSTACPKRGGKTSSRSRLARARAGMRSVMLDAKMPGATVLTRTPCRARSRASGRVMLCNAPLVAAYAVCPGWPSNCGA